jgi:hypothetical protein
MSEPGHGLRRAALLRGPSLCGAEAGSTPAGSNLDHICAAVSASLCNCKCYRFVLHLRSISSTVCTRAIRIFWRRCMHTPWRPHMITYPIYKWRTTWSPTRSPLARDGRWWTPWRMRASPLTKVGEVYLHV